MLYRFDGFTLDTATRRLLRARAERHLSPKAFDLLSFLVANRSRAVSKSELLRQVWPSTHVLETNLASLVAEIRQALGDSAETPRYLRTVHRFGYWFVGTVDEPEAAGASDGPPRYWLMLESRQVALSEGEAILGRAPDASVWIDAPGAATSISRMPRSERACASSKSAHFARTLGPALPRAFVQARYAYSFAERIEDIRHDRSNLDVEVGYASRQPSESLRSPRDRRRTVASTHPTSGGGLCRPTWASITIGLARLEMLDFDGGVQVTVSKSVEVFGSFMTTTAGRNSHALARGLTLGVSWSFGGASRLLSPGPPPKPNPDKSSSGASARNRSRSLGRQSRAHTISIFSLPFLNRQAFASDCRMP